MRVNYQTDADGRLQNITLFPFDETQNAFELPDGFDLQHVRDYVMRDGEAVYDPYSPEPTITKQITALKAQLSATDYAIIKIAEGAATVDEYADVIAQRQEWRKEVNALENNLTLEE